MFGVMCEIHALGGSDLWLGSVAVDIRFCVFL